MSTPLSARAAAFFDTWRTERRQSTQPTREEGDPEAPSSATSLIKDALPSLPSLPSINVGGPPGSPASKKTPSKNRNAAPVAHMAPRSATSSASKPGVKSSPASEKKNATMTRDERDDEADSDTDDAGESYPVRDEIVAEEPALWDPPFATTPSKPKVPARLPNSRRSRAARRSSPVLGAASSDAEEEPQPEPPKKATRTATRGKQEADKKQEEEQQEQEQEENDKGAGADAEDYKGVSQKKYSLKSIVSHRPKPGQPNIFELLVHWSAPSADEPVETWEPEETLHRDAPRALYTYWRRVGGREDHMMDPTLWYIEGVKKHRVDRNGKVDLEVSWVGSPERNWEKEEKVEDVAPLVLEEYWEAKGGRDNVLGKKRKAAGEKKRPVKRARK